MKASEWIDVKDILPPTNEPVLICDKYTDNKSEYYTGRWNGITWLVNINNVRTQCGMYCMGGSPESDDIDSYVSHWMPLPELPLTGSELQIKKD